MVDVPGEDIGVLFEREEGVPARATLVGEESHPVAGVDEVTDGPGVPGEPPVVPDLPVLHGGVQVHPDDDPLAPGEVVQRPVFHRSD